MQCNIGRYKMMYPGDQWKRSRNLITSPYHVTLEGAGACFGEECGYEKPLWFKSTTGM